MAETLPRRFPKARNWASPTSRTGCTPITVRLRPSTQRRRTPAAFGTQSLSRMTDNLRTLVIDDEPLAIDRLVDLLGQVEQVEVVGSATSGADAISKIDRLKPDLLLLDIEMPKIDGFDIVESLRQNGGEAADPPLICFVTAYPHFAADAFETGALDFLCKPVRLSRLQKMIERAAVAMKQREAEQRFNDLFVQLESL